MGGRSRLAWRRFEKTFVRLQYERLDIVKQELDVLFVQLPIRLAAAQDLLDLGVPDETREHADKVLYQYFRVLRKQVV